MCKRTASKLILLLQLLILACLPAAALPPQRSLTGEYLAGSIVIKTGERRLLYVKSEIEVEIYPIAVGREGRKWIGKSKISRKVLKPSWAPPPLIRKDRPELPALIGPGPNNPLGAAVLVLGDGTYGIHGTNRDETIGTDASYGCFRMHNDDILALFNKVAIGTVVYVQR
jgi:lipoprotein-anchoring transpeptidase ErfK/SrfK